MSFTRLSLRKMETILVKDFWYELPDDRIAKYPLAQRDASKLLVYRNQTITHHTFRDITALLPPGCTLFFNNTKVIPARLHFKKETGASIELFLLSPVHPSSVVAEAMISRGSSQWECTIGNLKRWKGEPLTLSGNGLSVVAELIDREKGIVKFSWEPAAISFAEMITQIGETPLPPYLHRKAEESDKEKYQTVYSKNEGAVAAPTAGLHFTQAVLDDLAKSGIKKDFLTLHVSAGTFQPIKVENALEHTMHAEQILVSRENIINLLNSSRTIAVGTTAMRTLESIYWYGVKLLSNPDEEFTITQEDAYRLPQNIEKEQALMAVQIRLRRDGTERISGTTSIFIRPGYQFRLCDGLITNFHQPGSTLILLIAALAGDRWREIYKEALANGYRFLSYGDSSLLIR